MSNHNQQQRACTGAAAQRERMQAHMKHQPKLARAIAHVVAEIKQYESDTFSASGSQITHSEALGVAARLIGSRLQLGENVDGLAITEALTQVRGK